MLHILWMLVKIILILLGIVLGLVVLALLLLLFCPVRYRADAVKEEGAVLEADERYDFCKLAFSRYLAEAFSKGRGTESGYSDFGDSSWKVLKKKSKKKAKAGFEKAAAEIEDIKEPAVKEPEKEETYRTSAEELEKRRAVKRKTPGSFLTGVLPLEEKKDRDFSKVME